MKEFLCCYPKPVANAINVVAEGVKPPASGGV
jgi:hypothetical protein